MNMLDDLDKKGHRLTVEMHAFLPNNALEIQLLRLT
jgi:hypothetical protein